MLDIVREHVAPLVDKRVEEEVVDIVVHSSIRLAPVLGAVNIHGRGKCWSCWVGGGRVSSLEGVGFHRIAFVGGGAVLLSRPDLNNIEAGCCACCIPAIRAGCVPIS